MDNGENKSISMHPQSYVTGLIGLVLSIDEKYFIILQMSIVAKETIGRSKEEESRTFSPSPPWS
jgi:hypothetical protein